jgi:DNA (cytosine-5)-methyltransferase 1
VNVLSLFTGIGGLDLGLQRAGMTIAGQVEIDPWCRRVLAKHWPEVPRHDDVRTCTDWWDAEPRPPVGLVAGGPPCQPFSHAGRKRGIFDERWMWPAMAAVVRAVRPRFVLVENVAALVRDRVAFGWVLGDLASLGFDAEWSLLSACAMGAPHPRERLLLVAYANSGHGQARLGTGQELGLARLQRRQRTGQGSRADARAWRDRVDWALEAARLDDRDADGSAAAMVEALGNAVVPQVAEHIGRMIMEAA